MEQETVFQKLMECRNCPRIAALVACIPGGYPPWEARYDLGADSDVCMHSKACKTNLRYGTTDKITWPDGREVEYTS